MGVRGLTSFLDTLPAAWKEIEMKKPAGEAGDAAGGVVKLVIDGHALLYHLYYSRNLCWAGSEYVAFAAIIKEYISTLHARNFSLFVVFSGISGSDDLEVEFQHENENIKRIGRLLKSTKLGEKVLPLMAYSTFCRVLAELKVNFVVVDGEADMAVASMAIKNGCCAVSKDSNFFIFDLPYGYIPCDGLNVSSKSLTVSARMYTPDRFAQTMNIKKELLPVFASLIGNEHVSGPVLRLFHQQVSTDFPQVVKEGEEEGAKTVSARHTLILSIGQLCEKQSEVKALVSEAVSMVRNKDLPAAEGEVAEKVDAEAFEQALMSSIASYDIKGKVVNIGETTSLKPSKDAPSIQGHFPTWLVSAYRKGEFSQRLMDVLVSKSFWCSCTMENVDEESAWVVATGLRAACYGVLLGPEPKDWGADPITVKEYMRKELKFEEMPVSATFSVNGKALPNIGTMNTVSEDVRRAFALDVLNAGEAIPKLTDALLVPAAALRAWALAAAAAGAKMHAWEVSVFVACAVATEHVPSAKKAAREDRPAWLTAKSLHRLAQYQTMLECAELVNEVFLRPLQGPLVGEVFDGVVAGRLYHQASKGASVSVLLRKVGGETERFKEMFDAITNGIDDQLEGEVVYEGVSSARIRSDKPVIPGQEKININSKNVFMQLDEFDDDDEDEEEEEESTAAEPETAPATAPAPESVVPKPKKEKKKTKEEEDIDALMAEMAAMETQKAAENEAKAAAKAAKKKAAKEKAKKK